MNIEISLEDLLKNGSHFGHNKKRWNPKWINTSMEKKMAHTF